MSDLKSLLLRINSVKSTKKITRVMQMIAASKLRLSQVLLSNSRTFANRVEDSIKYSLVHNKSADLSPEEGKNVIFIISSDKGLCGGYNSSIVKLFNSKTEELYQDKILIFIGKKAHSSLKNKVSSYDILPSDLTFADIKTLITKINNEFKVKAFYAVYTKFKSAMSLTPSFEEFSSISDNVSDIKSDDYSFEPNSKEVLEHLYSEHICAKLYQFVRESNTSEHMSRMLAMDGATKNAQKVADELTLQYNKSRQEKITRELIEIVSGAEAL